MCCDIPQEEGVIETNFIIENMSHKTMGMIKLPPKIDTERKLKC